MSEIFQILYFVGLGFAGVGVACVIAGTAWGLRTVRKDTGWWLELTAASLAVPAVLCLRGLGGVRQPGNFVLETFGYWCLAGAVGFFCGPWLALIKAQDKNLPADDRKPLVLGCVGVSITGVSALSCAFSFLLGSPH